MGAKGEKAPSTRKMHAVSRKERSMTTRLPQISLLDEQPGNERRGQRSLLVPARTAAEMCGKSLRTWRTWDAAGWIPRPVRIGRSTLGRVDELREWVDAGCPR